jgi:DNA-binding NtrC family response regulator
MSDTPIAVGRDTKKILVADRDGNRRHYLCSVLKSEEYRILAAENVLALIDTLHTFQIDLLVLQVDLPGILINELLSYIRKRHLEMKVILLMKHYSPDIERNLRPFKILYVMTWPIREELLRSIVSRGLEVPETELAYLEAGCP